MDIKYLENKVLENKLNNNGKDKLQEVFANKIR